MPDNPDRTINKVLAGIVVALFTIIGAVVADFFVRADRDAFFERRVFEKFEALGEMISSGFSKREENETIIYNEIRDNRELIKKNDNNLTAVKEEEARTQKALEELKKEK